jgi:hypothetical protein
MAERRDAIVSRDELNVVALGQLSERAFGQFHVQHLKVIQLLMYANAVALEQLFEILALRISDLHDSPDGDFAGHWLHRRALQFRREFARLEPCGIIYDPQWLGRGQSHWPVALICARDIKTSEQDRHDQSQGGQERN